MTLAPAAATLALAFGLAPAPLAGQPFETLTLPTFGKVELHAPTLPNAGSVSVSVGSPAEAMDVTAKARTNAGAEERRLISGRSCGSHPR